MKRRIVFLGPPASGKGTEARKLSAAHGIPHVSTGEMFREAIEADSPVGRLARQFIDNGELVPDEVVMGLVDEWLEGHAASEGFIFDGFPRTLGQAALLDTRLTGLKKPVDLAIWLDPSVGMIIQRVEGRRVCSQCAANYHVTRMPPKVAGRCDHCQAALVRRPDDTREMVLKRLEVYEQQSRGLTDYYAKQDKLNRIEGDLGPQEMFEAIQRVMA